MFLTNGIYFFYYFFIIYMKKSKRNNKRTNKRTNKRNIKRNNKRTNKRNKKRTKKSIGGVKIYTIDGRFTRDPKILHDGKDFFKKITHNAGEIEICELLMKNPHKNIIKIYDIGTDYVDMELLNTDIDRADINNIKNVMMEVKTYLQNLGIMYIDWKLDNIGISDDGEYKLFDFDCSGLIDKETNKWKVEPPKYWSYNKAIQNGMKTPLDIDNYAFEIGFKSHET